MVSNQYLNKKQFDFSDNAILTDLKEDIFVDAIEKAISLAKDVEQRKRNFNSNKIMRSWHNTLEDTINYMGDKYSNEKRK